MSKVQATSDSRTFFEVGTEAGIGLEDEARWVQPAFTASPLASLPKTTVSQQREFERLADEWERETRGVSSPSIKFSNPKYQRIIAMGESAIPLILTRMQASPGSWFEALKAIARIDDGNDPVPQAHWGDLAAMTDDWIRWGMDNGYIDTPVDIVAMS